MTVSPGTNAPSIVLLSLPSKILSFFSRKRSHFPPSGDPLLFSVMAGSGWPRVFRTTSRSPGFCGKRKAAKLHGLNPLKMPLFQEYGNKTIFSSGVGTPSIAEFPGQDPPGTSPSVNRSGMTYSPVPLILYKRREYPERDPNPLTGVRVPIPVRLQPSDPGNGNIIDPEPPEKYARAGCGTRSRKSIHCGNGRVRTSRRFSSGSSS